MTPDRRYMIWVVAYVAAVWAFFYSGLDARVGLEGMARGAVAGGTLVGFFLMAARLWTR